MSKNKRSYKKLGSPPSQNSKKIKLSPSNHAPTCDDSTCTGCDVSEIEIVFTTEDGQGEIELSPVKLLHLALEESSKESSQEHGGGVAKRLFDMALEGCQYATCCVAFGIYLPFVEYIRKGVEIFKQITAEDVCYYDAWIGLGRARISLAKIEREMTQQKSSITEQNSYNLATDALDKGLSILRSKDKDKYMTESILVAKDLKEYALSINHSKFNDYTQKILSQAINYLQTCYELDSKKLDQNNFAQGIWGSCLYYLAKLKTNQDSNDYIREFKLLLNSAIEKLLKAYNDSLEKDRFTEILGQAYILKTTIESDEEQIIEAYDKGLECLKEAYKLFPDNENLRDQLVTLDVFDSNSVNKRFITVNAQSNFYELNNFIDPKYTN
ncbi:708_t:CDS:10 [Rhizophagus irregularis]|nr:708_t:CDS:10 [Rhizophagus irregularis]